MRQKREYQERSHDPRGAPGAVHHRQGPEAGRGVSSQIGEVLRGRGAEKKEPEDRPDVPGLEAPEIPHAGPPRDLEQHTPWNRDDDVRQVGDRLPAKRRRGIRDGEHRRGSREQRALRADRRGERESRDVEPAGEPDRLLGADATGGQRPPRLVDHVRLEVGDLIEDVGGRVQDRRHDGPERDLQADPEGERNRMLGPERDDAAREHAERGGDQREGSGELPVQGQLLSHHEPRSLGKLVRRG